MTLFVLASRRPADAWEHFVAPSAQILGPHLGGRGVIDYRSILADQGAIFRGALTSGPPESVFLALCHGDQGGTLHVDGQGFIGVRDADLFRDKFCYFVACSAGRQLGPAAVKSGAVGYIGFLRPIVSIPSTRQDEQRQAYLSGLVAYLQGESVPRAAETMRNELRRTIKSVSKGSGKDEDIFLMGMLTNCLAQLTWGPRVPRPVMKAAVSEATAEKPRMAPPSPSVTAQTPMSRVRKKPEKA